MSREILFRAVSKLNGNWVYGSYVKHLETIQDEFQDFDIYIETLGQFTGLTDKKGTKIFEGDIVKGCSKSYKPNYMCEVYFNKNMCHYGLTINKGSYTKHQTHDWLELTNAKSKKLEVIGNIYDNPELLKED